MLSGDVRYFWSVSYAIITFAWNVSTYAAVTHFMGQFAGAVNHYICIWKMIWCEYLPTIIIDRSVILVRAEHKSSKIDALWAQNWTRSNGMLSINSDPFKRRDVSKSNRSHAKQNIVSLFRPFFLTQNTTTKKQKQKLIVLVSEMRRKKLK